MQKNAPNNLEIQLSDEMTTGVFANLAILNHSDSEFVMDFVYLQPNTPKGKVRARIIMTPEQIKRFMMAVGDNLNKYEQKFGPIKIHTSLNP